jgi:hypothetical protein
MKEDLIEQFKENAKVHFNIDYGNKKSVKAGNKAVDRMFEIAQKLNDSGHFNEFAALLSCEEDRVNVWTAHMLLERLNATGSIAEEALSVITELANSDDINSFGEKLWLEHWHAKQQ